MQFGTCYGIYKKKTICLPKVCTLQSETIQESNHAQKIHMCFTGGNFKDISFWFNTTMNEKIRNLEYFRLLKAFEHIPIDTS